MTPSSPISLTRRLCLFDPGPKKNFFSAFRILLLKPRKDKQIAFRTRMVDQEGK